MCLLWLKVKFEPSNPFIGITRAAQLDGCWRHLNTLADLSSVEPMRRTRHVIAVVVVATALCATDRSAVAAPAVHAKTQAGVARTFASRITTSLRRAVATNAIQPVQTMETARPFPLIISQRARGVRSNFSPFQFRLPPPTR